MVNLVPLRWSSNSAPHPLFFVFKLVPCYDIRISYTSTLSKDNCNDLLHYYGIVVRRSRSLTYLPDAPKDSLVPIILEITDAARCEPFLKSVAPEDLLLIGID